LSERERIGVTDGQLRGSAADRLEAPGRTAVQLQLRRTAGPADDFDVAPQDILRAAGAERLHRGFLGREPAGKVDRRMTPAHAVGDFAARKNTLSESIAIPLEGRDDTRNFCGIESKADDGHASQA